MTLCSTTEAAVEGHARRGAWPWEARGVPTSVTAAVGWLTTSRDVPCGDHPPRHAPSGIPVAVPRPIIPHSPGDPPSCPLATDSYANSHLWISVGVGRICSTIFLDTTAHS